MPANRDAFACGVMDDYRSYGTPETALNKSVRASAAETAGQMARPMGHPAFAGLALNERGHCEAAVAFLDLRAFTARTFWDSPDDVVQLARAVLTQIVEVVDDFGGHVLGLRGDGVFACFGGPDSRQPSLDAPHRRAATGGHRRGPLPRPSCRTPSTTATTRRPSPPRPPGGRIPPPATPTSPPSPLPSRASGSTTATAATCGAARSTPDAGASQSRYRRPRRRAAAHRPRPSSPARPQRGPARLPVAPAALHQRRAVRGRRLRLGPRPPHERPGYRLGRPLVRRLHGLEPRRAVAHGRVPARCRRVAPRPDPPKGNQDVFLAITTIGPCVNTPTPGSGRSSPPSPSSPEASSASATRRDAPRRRRSSARRPRARRPRRMRPRGHHRRRLAVPRTVAPADQARGQPLRLPPPGRSRADAADGRGLCRRPPRRMDPDTDARADRHGQVRVLQQGADRRNHRRCGARGMAAARPRLRLAHKPYRPASPPCTLLDLQNVPAELAAGVGTRPLRARSSVPAGQTALQA